MVSVKNGILRIDSGSFESTMRLIFDICFFLSNVIYFDFYNRPLHNLGVALSFLGTGCILLTKIQSRRLTHISFGVWYMLFMVFSRLSTIWAFSPGTAETRYFNIMLYTLIYSFGITQYIEYKEDFEKIISNFVAASTVIALSQFLASSPRIWFAGFFGSALGQNNSNTFGIIMLYCALFAFYKAYTLNKKRFYPIFLFSFFCCILSSSRKAFLISFVGAALIMVFSKNKKMRFIHISIALILLIIGILAIFETDALYKIIGYRLENLIKFNSGETVQEGSLPMRKFMIDYAKQLFRSRPILGYGYANYSIMLAENTYLRRAVYAHNTYYELLADLGIVGFALYYSSHAYISIKLLVKYFKEKFNSITMLAIVIMITKFTCDTATVSMLEPNFQAMLAIAFSAVFIDVTQSKKQFFFDRDSRS